MRSKRTGSMGTVRQGEGFRGYYKVRIAEFCITHAVRSTAKVERQPRLYTPPPYKKPPRDEHGNVRLGDYRKPIWKKKPRTTRHWKTAHKGVYARIIADEAQKLPPSRHYTSNRSELGTRRAMSTQGVGKSWRDSRSSRTNKHCKKSSLRQ